MEKDSYDFKNYEDFFQGSMGRRVGISYGGIDDFTLITPKFNTNLTVYQSDMVNQVTRTGSFTESVLNMENIDEGSNPSTNRYAVYPGDYAELIFTNNIEENNSILMIKDSFALPVYSFLAPTVEKINAIDMRYFTKNVLEYASEVKPEIVIILYNGDCFNDEMFDFNLSGGNNNDYFKNN